MIIIDDKLLNKISNKASKTERKRLNYNFHSDYTDPINRMLNALDVGTYVKPHRHKNPDKIEVFILLRGRLLVVEFNDSGDITAHTILDYKKNVFAVEIAAATWHTVIPLENNTIVYEIKNGPYSPLSDKDFAPWAPDEFSSETLSFNTQIMKRISI
jgi:cupin fold WbuC family metalloprotein